MHHIIFVCAGVFLFGLFCLDRDVAVVNVIQGLLYTRWVSMAIGSDRATMSTPSDRNRDSDLFERDMLLKIF
eukprot:m.426882 g.426882  ORF g.426882 m.426882 type:complete len:72 (+) comp21359_c0_seq7:1197-1412(+)